MKKLIRILLALALAASLLTSAAAETVQTDAVTFDGTGLRVSWPFREESLSGTFFPEDVGLMSQQPDVYLTQFVYSALSREELTSQRQALQAKSNAGTLTQEEVLGYYSQFCLLGAVLASDDRDYIASWLTEDNAVRLGTGGDMEYIYLSFPSNGTYATRDTFTADEAYLAEMDALEKQVLEGLRSAELSGPYDPMRSLIGQVIRFEARDLDGNTVTSEALFGSNRVTLVNVWGTWCPYCVQEMAELAEIHTRLQEKGCGVVGIEMEYTWGDETVQAAKDLMAREGTNYPSVIRPENHAIFSQVTGYPTSFLVDSQGTILAAPIVGANVAAYEPSVDALLSSGKVREPEAAAAESDPEAEAPAAQAADAFRVLVQDASGPVPEVALQFCDESTCSLVKTDTEGAAAFEAPAGKAYEVHVLMVPEGYRADSTVYAIGPEYGELVITLQPAE